MTTVFRADLSEYFPKNFSTIEQQKLESVKSVKYVQDNVSEVILTNSSTVIENLNIKNTKLIIHPNSGYDNFSPNFVKNFNGTIIVGNPIRQRPVTEYILSAIFSKMNSFPYQEEWSSNRNWDRKLISDQRILIIGYGHIGKIVFKTLSTLTSSIEISDPFLCLERKSKLKDFDFIINCSSLNPTSFHMINEEFLKELSSNVTIINAARGKHINFDHLIGFLKKYPHAKCFVDVFEQEPIQLEKFNSLPNIFTSSHIAGVDLNLTRRLIEFEENILYDYIQFKQNKLDFNKKHKDLILKNKIIDNYLI
ncbi:MAG: hypothetical protein HOJ35_00805 [Bdellovibrionales bacterium]|jgi:D-3-phosphoglycerate dehydrogenase / 2-oxoglutarate reductase|nr:hypothetical protein [Bdellovibrionales bacterium]